MSDVGSDMGNQDLEGRDKSATDEDDTAEDGVQVRPQISHHVHECLPPPPPPPTSPAPLQSCTCNLFQPLTLFEMSYTPSATHIAPEILLTKFCDSESGQKPLIFQFANDSECQPQ